MGQASSATRTCRALASASEYTAATRNPERRAVRVIRQAISPRLAIKQFSRTCRHPCASRPIVRQSYDLPFEAGKP